ncbi:MAG: alpha-mannosidase, partial [Phototrophicales bacterium]
TYTVVKAAFPLNLHSERVACEIACGTIERPTVGKTEAERAKWEISAHHWADLTDPTQNYGVSIFNDCKYGYDAGVNQLRLTLLRGSKWPDPHADRGKHQFAYAIYPHQGGWQNAKTVQRGY